MTTIAYHHGDSEIAADGRLTAGGDIVHDRADKSVKVGARTFYCCGKRGQYQRFAEDCENGKAVDWEPDVSAIMVEKGRAFLCSVHDRRYCVSPLDYNEAIGSGASYAVAAMDFGRSAREAVRYASTRDVYTGGRVKVWKLKRTG